MQKILVIGSGPIVIGQAAEFDYAGTQACKALREEGYRVVLINSNPATIMTDEETADAVYIEPLNVDFCERVIARERPDGLLPTLGGQTGLNLATQLANAGVLERYGVRLLGTPLRAIQKAEDREEFRQLMREIKEPVPESWIIESPSQLEEVLDAVPYPCIIRPAYTLGGTGGGIAHTREELLETGLKGLQLSMRSQIMIERSLLGWKEVEYEVMRDRKGNCITICNMENFDPMGVHTGDSIVVAPSQTLSDIEYHMLRTASLKIIRALGIEGGCNVQLAVNPESFDYYVIEVNPRVSRSSALASKATGYPIARVSAKIAVGRTLDEIDNEVTGTTKACFEPALDYCVVKIPRWPFDKFPTGDRTLFTQMKATGEVMAIDRSFEAALMKAIRGLEVRQKDLRHAKFQGTSSMAVPAMGPTGVPPVEGSMSGMAVPAMGPTGVPPVEESHPLVAEIELDRDAIHKRHGAYLPHWRTDGAIYFVTFRLADALPAEARERLRREREHLERREANHLISPQDAARLRLLQRQEVEELLDRGSGECLMGRPEMARLVAQSLLHFDGERYRLHAWAVMPNHVHVVVEPLAEEELEKIIHSWKSFTGHAIAKELGRTGAVWQAEYYDRLIRDGSECEHYIRYTEENPAKAGLRDWEWVSKHGGMGAQSAGQRGVADHGRDGHETHGREAHDAGEAQSAGQRDAAAHGRDGHETHGRDAHATVGLGPMSDDELRRAIARPTDERLWAVAEGLRRGWGIDEVNRLSKVDRWFLQKMQNLLAIERRLVEAGNSEGRNEDLSVLIEEAFLIGYPSASIASLLGVETATSAFAELARTEIERQKVMPVFKMVDTCAGEFESHTPYYYGTFEMEDDAKPLDRIDAAS